MYANGLDVGAHTRSRCLTQLHSRSDGKRLRGRPRETRNECHITKCHVSLLLQQDLLPESSRVVHPKPKVETRVSDHHLHSTFTCTLLHFTLH
jgi:hypothetical protein